MDDENGLCTECEVCGGTDFYKESGHYYCSECQTQSQKIREHVFEREDHTINKKSTRKIRKEKDKHEHKLTSWECYNIILKGLTDELILLGAKSELKVVVKCLWMKYLHKCEVFSIKSNKPPKFSILGSKRDIDILFNRKPAKRKRCPSVTSSVSNLSIKRQISSKKRALIHSHYEEISLSQQSLTQNSSLVGETLSSIPSDSEKSDTSSKRIMYNKFSKKEMTKLMSKNHQKAHSMDTMGTLTCHKLLRKDFTNKFKKGPTVLTICTLYCLLYLGLLIIEDPIQLNDIIRFIKEGHLSYGNFRHFFDENLKDEFLVLPTVPQNVFCNQYFRLKAARMVKFLDVTRYVRRPDLVVLCRRYCEELNLPAAVRISVERIIEKSKPLKTLGKTQKELPNYEGRVLGIIVVVLKLFYGLDGVTEKRLSAYAREVNGAVPDANMFDFEQWLMYIRCREMVVQKYHLISGLDRRDNVDGRLYMNYIHNQRISFKTNTKSLPNELKDYHQILSMVRGGCDAEEKFPATLTPFSVYADVILRQRSLPCQDLLQRKFTDDSLDFLLKPNNYLSLLDVRRVKNGGANDNVITEEMLHHHLATFYAWKTGNRTVTVKLNDDDGPDQNLQEYLDLFRKDEVRTIDAKVLLDNWQKGHEKQFKLNRILLQTLSESDKTARPRGKASERYTEHFNPYERYWLNVDANPTKSYYSKRQADCLIGKMPLSLRTIFLECARIAEQTVNEFYTELLLTELCLVYPVNLWDKKQNNTHTATLKDVLKSCYHRW
ncbi:hypothetical protein GWI33_016464 [Rhynchophorus ferrugineus]|uniref:Rrn7/TAF1B C-terminal cyclin domain-containing protein n=1 Tax=Rhynchophorus ferrugineus TaxID=354439 RepID=A0A834I0T7_RHYFE|nr:hypothetical protein GWI33_016464 [Rhynchophorus ferrugineus]